MVIPIRYVFYGLYRLPLVFNTIENALHAVCRPFTLFLNGSTHLTKQDSAISVATVKYIPVASGRRRLFSYNATDTTASRTTTSFDTDVD